VAPRAGRNKPGSKVNRFTSSVFTNPFRRRNYAGKKTRKRFLDYVFHQKSLVTPAQVLFAYPDFGNSHFFLDFFSHFLAEFTKFWIFFHFFWQNFSEFVKILANSRSEMISFVTFSENLRFRKNAKKTRKRGPRSSSCILLVGHSGDSPDSVHIDPIRK
jgi:hypothetical protein